MMLVSTNLFHSSISRRRLRDPDGRPGGRFVSIAPDYRVRRHAVCVECPFEYVLHASTRFSTLNLSWSILLSSVLSSGEVLSRL